MELHPQHLLLLLLLLPFLTCEAVHESAAVAGYVACDACLERRFTKNTMLLPGVTVAITCKDAHGNSLYSTVQTTDKHGTFVARIPKELASSEPSACAASVVRNPVARCSLPLTSVGSMLHPVPNQQQQQTLLVSAPFIFTPSEAHTSCPRRNSEQAGASEASTAFAQNLDSSGGSSSSGSSSSASEEKPVNTNPSGFPAFGSGFGTPGGASVFPSFPSNAPPLFPPFGGGIGSGIGGFPPFGTGFNFPQLPPFQFPFFTPPPGSKK